MKGQVVMKVRATKSNGKEIAKSNCVRDPLTQAPPVTLLDRVVTTDRGADIPLHAQIRRALRTLIQREFQDGQRFWTEAALAEHMNVAHVTVRRALADLAREGVLERKVSTGTTVRKAPQSALSFTSIGVFFPHYDSSAFGTSIEVFGEYCNLTGRKLNIYYTKNGESTSQAFNRLHGTPSQERIIVFGNPPDTSFELGTALEARGYRYVMVNSTHPALNASYVGMDEYGSMNAALAHLTKFGHKRILFMVNEPGNVTNVIRLIKAFQDLTETQGLTECSILSCKTKHWESSYDAAFNNMSEVWRLSPRPTALVAVSPAGAYAALKWLRLQGVSVPSEISVMGLSDAEPGEFMTPSVTSLASMSVEHAKLALEVLVDDAESCVVKLSHPLVIARESTGPIRSADLCATSR